MYKHIALAVALLIAALSAQGQVINNPLTATLSASSTDCSVSNSCAWQLTQMTAGQTVITITGSFSGTFLVEQTNNGTTWTTAATLTGTGTTTYNQNGYTAIRVRCSALTSGTAIVTVSTGTGGSSTGGGLSPVSSLPASCTAGTSQPVQLTASLNVGVPPITYGPGTILYCDSTNHYSPVSQGSGASPIMGFYLSNQCPPSNSAQCFYTPSDVQQINTCGWTSSTVTCTGSPFVAADVGKTIMGWDKCQLFNTGGAGVNAMVNPAGSNTIAGFTNVNVVTLTSPVSNTEAGTAGCIVWGHLDDTGAAAVDAAAQAAPQCPKINFAAAGYFFTQPHFYTVPASCSNLPFTFPSQTSLGNMFYSGGYELEGRGTGATIIWLTPNFPNGVTCNHGLKSFGCFQIPVEGRWSQFSITGGGDNSTQNGVSLIEINGPASLDNFTVSNWNPNGGGSVNPCIGLTGWVMFYQVIDSQCGNIGIGGSGSSPGNTFLNAYKLTVDSIKQWSISINWPSSLYGMVCYECNINVMRNSAVGIQLHNATGLKLYRSSINLAGTTPTSPQAIATDAGPVIIDLQDVGLNMTGAVTSGTCMANASIQQTAHLQNVVCTAVGTGKSINDGNVASVLVDEGGNSGFSTGAGPTINGNVVNESNSANGIPVTAAKTVLSAGWGSTAAVTALKGGNSPIQFTITNSGTGQGASPTITYTFPTPYFVAPFSCTATQTGGTNAVLPLASSSLTTTGVVFTATGTPTAGSTEIVQVACVTP